MTNEIAIRDDAQLVTRSAQITDVQRLGGLLAASGYFSDATAMAQAAVKVLAGEELGIPPVASMMGMYIVKGKIVLSGNLIASRIRAHGYNYKHRQFDAKGCVLEFVGKAGETLGVSSFTEEDAKNAGCFSDMYKKYPRNMYFNRAISNGAKWYTPEVFAGAPVYVAEELGCTIDEQGDYLAPEPKPAEVQRQVADRKIAEMKAGKTYAEVSEVKPLPAPEAQPADVDPAAAGIKERLAQFAQIKVVVGAPTYYQILGSHGFEHANAIKDLSKAREIYRELKQAQIDQVSRGTV